MANKQKEIHLEPRIRGNDGAFYQPDAVILDKPSNKIFVVDFAVAYETSADSLNNAYASKISKYAAIRSAVATKYGGEEESTSILPLVTGARGCFDEKLIQNLRALGLTKRTARNMAETAAEQATFVFNAFTGISKWWRPNRQRRAVAF